MSIKKNSEFEPSAPPLDAESSTEENVSETTAQSSKYKPSAPLIKTPSFCLPCTQVELTLSASSLLNLDQVTHSDPLCVLFLLDSTTSEEWVEIGRTEAIRNNLNPEWKTKFILDYRFEEKQTMTFMVYDADCKKYSLENHDFLGKLECSLGEIVSAPNSTFTRALKLPSLHGCSKRNPSITVTSEELSDCKKFVTFQLSYNNSNGTGRFQKKTVFANVSKQISDGTWILLYRASAKQIKSIDKSESVDFLQITFRYASILSQGTNEMTPLRFQIMQMKQGIRGKSSSLMGEVVTNYKELLEKSKSVQPIRLQLKSFKDSRSNIRESRDAGIIDIMDLKCTPQKSFVDYLHEGMEINFAVAIDFTSSNGKPTSHDSLHWKNPVVDNPYVMTLKIIGEILQDYSTTKKMYAYGFGAKGFPFANRVNHKFPLNFKETNPLCNGIEDILRCYYRVLQRVKLFYPTHLAPIIKEITAIAKVSLQETTIEKYFVLVILTDGCVCDPETTRSAIVEASNAPVSIIIIGIGNEDFTAMERLDSDEKLLKCGNQQAKRDIVQFVELKKYVNFKSISPISKGSKVALSRSVLAELPQQVVSWMSLHKT